jgi:hypothetical protein
MTKGVQPSSPSEQAAEVPRVVGEDARAEQKALDRVLADQPRQALLCRTLRVSSGSYFWPGGYVSRMSQAGGGLGGA